MAPPSVPSANGGLASDVEKQQPASDIQSGAFKNVETKHAVDGENNRVVESMKVSLSLQSDRESEYESEIDTNEDLSVETEPDQDSLDNNENKSKFMHGKNRVVGAVSAASLIFASYSTLRRRQDHMTSLPSVLAAPTLRNRSILSLLSNITSKALRPSIPVGTFASLNSAHGYFRAGPLPPENNTHSWREIVVNPHDREVLAVDWEMPHFSSASETESVHSGGIIRRSVVLLLHGLNNDSSFGYVRACSRAAADAGFVVASLNYRGCGGTKLQTVRGFNAGFTGDLRCVVDKIAERIWNGDGNIKADGSLTPCRLFLVGFSLGANMVVKFLGEEGREGSLHPIVGGAVSVSNPFRLNGATIPYTTGFLLGMGVKRTFLRNVNSPVGHFAARCSTFGNMFKSVMWAPTIGSIDNSFAPHMICVEAEHPFVPHTRGYADGAEYWAESSSSRLVGFVNVPLLVLTAEDDFISGKGFMSAIYPGIVRNPNIIVIRTTTGGHLGWHDASSFNVFGRNPLGRGLGWADMAVVDFLKALLATTATDNVSKISEQASSSSLKDNRGSQTGEILKGDNTMLLQSKL
uniref:Serine aminopeptidase S33 domain-containing protein n=1 Tax=Corethron hystrix TaxID=216773 RepID=A0A7S1FL56_9STRA|mmetsp:Transcript_10802/g.23722  ORF Transcript_10802/g.23722 Transcript_10802/m.23722 type:complete len:578 (+) Transcript_10802:1-1734(+)